MTSRQAIRNDVAVLEAGDATIESIDGITFNQGNNGAFDLQPGGHTIEISGVWIRPTFGILPINDRGFGTLCLKARGGRRYRISEVRRVKADEIQYFDHPSVGVIAVVSGG